MKGPSPSLVATVGVLLVTFAACDMPECIDGPSNLTPETTASCVAPSEGTEPETEIVSASAEILDDGTLVLTWSSWGLTCGTQAGEIPPPEDCQTTGWALTAEIPPELITPSEGGVEPGSTTATSIIDLAEHPEVLGTATVTNGGDGISSGSYGGESFFVGTIELVQVGDECVTGVLHGFGTGNVDPTLGGPELEGSFFAPRC